MDEDLLVRASRWLGSPLSETDPFDRYARWLREEAIPAGGLGPQEANRILDRHILDSLFFAAAWERERPPERVLDIGSGVGLPAIPLAILWRDTAVIAVERSGRRVDLLNRVRRILDLTNLSVSRRSVTEAPSAPMVTMRAVLPPDRWDELVPHIEPDGIGVVGLPVETPAGTDIVVVPPTVTGTRYAYRVLRPSSPGGNSRDSI